MTANPRRTRKTTKLVVDEKLLADLAEYGRLQCTCTEAAAKLDTSVKQLEQTLAKNHEAHAAFEKGRAQGLEALRRAQFKLAETSASMAMFLGRTYLDQSDRRETEQSGAKDVSTAVQRLKVMLANAASVAPPQSDREGD